MTADPLSMQNATKKDIAAIQTELSGKANQSALSAKADKTRVDIELAGKAASVHTHAQSEVTGLTTALQGIGTALNGKASKAVVTQSADGLMSVADKTKLDGMSQQNVPIATNKNVGVMKPDGVTTTVDADGTITAVGGGGGGVSVHNALTDRNATDAHPMSAITGLDTALGGRAPASHGHEMSEINGLTNALAAKLPVSTAASTYATKSELEVGLDDKADASDLDAYATTTALTTGLAGKVDTNDNRLMNARMPTPHASTHGIGGTDALPAASSTVAGLIQLATETEVTDSVEE